MVNPGWMQMMEEILLGREHFRTHMIPKRNAHLYEEEELPDQICAAAAASGISSGRVVQSLMW